MDALVFKYVARNGQYAGTFASRAGHCSKNSTEAGQMYYPHELHATLLRAIRDGGVGARQLVEHEAEISEETEITHATYVALAAWGEEGLAAIVRAAMTGEKLNRRNAAITVLTALAGTGTFPSGTIPFVPDDLLNEAAGRIQGKGMDKSAKRALRLLVMSVPHEDLVIPLGVSVMHLSLSSPDLIRTLAISLSASWINFGLGALDTYDEMLSSSAYDEPSFQEFFCTHPQLLDPMAIQVWSQPDFHGVLRPDFLIRRADDTYVVVEIECPGKALLTQTGQLSNQATHAEKQAVDYESFLSERQQEARLHYPNYRPAECLAVIGLERRLSDAQKSSLQRANAQRLRSKIVGFDHLLERSRAILSNVAEGDTIEVIRKQRMF